MEGTDKLEVKKRERVKKKLMSMKHKESIRESLSQPVTAGGVEVRMSSVAMGTTDDAIANKYVEYEVDIYFSTNSKELDIAGGNPGKFPVRQLNMNLTRLPGVQRNDVSENKRPVIVSGCLYARPQFTLETANFGGNPNIYYGRLVTPLGSSLGVGLADDVALYDNGVKNLEADVHQNYVVVAHMHYLDAMPNNAPSSRNVSGDDFTNLLVLSLARPDGQLWDETQINFRFVLRYRVPVVLSSTVDFFVNRFDNEGVTEPTDGILSVAKALKDTIAPQVGTIDSPVEVQQLVFPDAKRVMKQ